MNTLSVVFVESFFSCNHCPQKILLISLQHKPPAGFGYCWIGSREGEFTWCILGCFRMDGGKALSTQSFKERKALQHRQVSAAKDSQPGIFQCSPRKAEWPRRAESSLSPSAGFTETWPQSQALVSPQLQLLDGFSG